MESNWKWFLKPQTINEEIEKEEFINYYNTKFNANEKKKVKLDDGQIVEQNYMPGIFEYYSALNKNNKNLLMCLRRRI